MQMCWSMSFRMHRYPDAGFHRYTFCLSFYAMVHFCELFHRKNRRPARAVCFFCPVGFETSSGSARAERAAISGVTCRGHVTSARGESRHPSHRRNPRECVAAAQSVPARRFAGIPPLKTGPALLGSGFAVLPGLSVFLSGGIRNELRKRLHEEHNQ